MPVVPPVTSAANFGVVNGVSPGTGEFIVNTIKIYEVATRASTIL
jgi:hypothetical protein